MFNFGQYFDILSTSAANELKMAMEEEDLSASVIFLAIFPGNGHVFLALHQTTRLNIQTVVLLSV